MFSLGRRQSTRLSFAGVVLVAFAVSCAAQTSRVAGAIQGSLVDLTGKSIEFWKHYIQNDHVEIAGARHLQPTDPVESQADEVVLFLQPHFQDFRHLSFVFDNQHAHGSPSTLRILKSEP